MRAAVGPLRVAFAGQVADFLVHHQIHQRHSGFAQQVADAVKKRGGSVQLKIYQNEGHGFARVENQIDAYQKVSGFLKVHVPSPGCGCSIYE